MTANFSNVIIQLPHTSKHFQGVSESPMCLSVVRAGNMTSSQKKLPTILKYTMLDHSGGMKPCTGACHTMTDDVIESVL